MNYQRLHDTSFRLLNPGASLLPILSAIKAEYREKLKELEKATA